MRRPAALRRGLSGRQTGSVIGAVFGVVYVEANASDVGQPGSLAVRVAGVSAFVACLVLLRRGLRRHSAPSAESPRFGPRYWLVVVAEAAVLLAGWYALNGPLGRPDAALPWVTLVVGAHFFALAVVFRARVQHLLGASLTLCGAIGLALALGGVPMSTVALAAGICPGFVLLAFSLWGLTGSWRAAATRAHGRPHVRPPIRQTADVDRLPGEEDAKGRGAGRDSRPGGRAPMNALASRGRFGDDDDHC